jgi:hypothetical protein
LDVSAALACGGIDGGANETGGLFGGLEAGGCDGYGASSTILCVGASFCWGAPDENGTPQPPQNRESSAFTVPHVGQRIPPSSVTQRAFQRLIVASQPSISWAAIARETQWVPIT